MLQNLRTQPQVKGRNGEEMTDTTFIRGSNLYSKTLQDMQLPQPVVFSRQGQCIEFTQRNLHMRGLMLPLLLAQERPFLPTLLRPGLRRAVGSTGGLKVDLGSRLSRCVLPAHLKAYLFLAVLASHWEKRQLPIMLSDGFLLHCPW